MPDWPAGFIPPFDHLRVPFVFVPDGEPMPEEWLAAHPGWVKFRATLRPRPQQPLPDPPPEPEPEPEQIWDAEPVAITPRPRAPHLRQVPLLSRKSPPPPTDLRPGDLHRNFERGALQAAKLYATDPNYLIRVGMTAYRAQNHLHLGNQPNIPPRNSQADKRSQPDRSSYRSIFEPIATGDLKCQGFAGGCRNGGSFGMTGAYEVTGRILCASCAERALGFGDLPGAERTEAPRPFSLSP